MKSLVALPFLLVFGCLQLAAFVPWVVGRLLVMMFEPVIDATASTVTAILEWSEAP